MIEKESIYFWMCELRLKNAVFMSARKTHHFKLFCCQGVHFLQATVYWGSRGLAIIIIIIINTTIAHLLGCSVCFREPLTTFEKCHV